VKNFKDFYQYLE